MNEINKWLLTVCVCVQRVAWPYIVYICNNVNVFTCAARVIDALKIHSLAMACWRGGCIWTAPNRQRHIRQRQTVAISHVYRIFASSDDFVESIDFHFTLTINCPFCFESDVIKRSCARAWLTTIQRLQVINSDDPFYHAIMSLRNVRVRFHCVSHRLLTHYHFALVNTFDTIDTPPHNQGHELCARAQTHAKKGRQNEKKKTLINWTSNLCKRVQKTSPFFSPR